MKLKKLNGVIVEFTREGISALKDAQNASKS